MSPYNLRSKKRPKLNCYQERRNIPPHYNPLVVFKERVPVIDSNTHRYQITEDNKVLVKEIVNDYSKRFDLFLKCLCTIIFLSSLYYFREDIQNCFKYEISPFTRMNISVVNEKSDMSEIRSFVRSVLYEPGEEKEGEGTYHFEKEGNGRPMSFIEEQCSWPEDSGKSDDSVINVDDIFDRENLTDYALETKGAKIVTIFDTETYGFVSLKIWGLEFGLGLNYFYQNYFNSIAPNKILMPWRKPGDCWAFKGSYGRVKIKLWDQIQISAITIDHIRTENFSVESISSAPKTFSVAASENENSSGMFLGTFEYSITGPSAQTFLISPKSPVVMKNPCRFVEITIKSNHGNQDYTCLCRVRVHGRK